MGRRSAGLREKEIGNFWLAIRDIGMVKRGLPKPVSFGLLFHGDLGWASEGAVNTDRISSIHLDRCVVLKVQKQLEH